MSLSVNASTTDAGALVCVTGEVDVSNASELRDAIDAALAEKPAELRVDLAEVPYIDSTGIGVLVGAAHRAAESGSKLVVARPQKNVERVLGLLGVGADLNIVSE
jgi:anti-sigma B factor antagonist